MTFFLIFYPSYAAAGKWTPKGNPGSLKEAEKKAEELQGHWPSSGPSLLSVWPGLTTQWIQLSIEKSTEAEGGDPEKVYQEGTNQQGSKPARESGSSPLSFCFAMIFSIDFWIESKVH